MKFAIWAEDLLVLMAYGLDLFARPTFDKCNQSYEGWLYNNERKTWRTAFDADPLLPLKLCPAGYQGTHAWQCRNKLLKLMGTFRKLFPNCHHSGHSRESGSPAIIQSHVEQTGFPLSRE